MYVISCVFHTFVSMSISRKACARDGDGVGDDGDGVADRMLMMVMMTSFVGSSANR